MARRKRRMGTPNVTTVATVSEVKGSPRHVAKTHGSHNGRVDSWPHLSDALDRPAHLRDRTRVRPDKPTPSRHFRLGQRQIRSTLGTDSLRAHAVLGNPRWDVAVMVDDRLKDSCVCIHVTVTARDTAEAEALGSQLAEKMCPCIVLNASAERR